VERVPIWGLGGRGAHRGKLAVVRKSAVERWSMATWTSGRWRRRSGRGGIGCPCGAPQGGGGARGGQSMAVNGEVLEEEAAAGEEPDYGGRRFEQRRGAGRRGDDDRPLGRLGWR
jgi:hypothetical protein